MKKAAFLSCFFCLLFLIVSRETFYVRLRYKLEFNVRTIGCAIVGTGVPKGADPLDCPFVQILADRPGVPSRRQIVICHYNIAISFVAKIVENGLARLRRIFFGRAQRPSPTIQIITES